MLKPQRLASPDILKAFSIIMVPVVHGAHVIPLGPDSSSMETNADWTYLFTTSLRVCVPVFIFLFAYFQERSILKHGNVDVFKRFYRLLIPFLFWSCLYLFITADRSSLSFSKLITTHWLGFGWAGQYYFLVIFQLLFLFPFFRWLASRIAGRIFLVYLLSVAFFAFCAYSGWFTMIPVKKISWRPFIYWLPYVLLGIMYARGIKLKFSLSIPYALLCLALIPLEIIYFKPDNSTGFEFPMMFVASMILINAVMNSALTYDSLPAGPGKAINFLAKNTLGIFCLNPLVIFILQPLFYAKGFYIQFPGSFFLMPVISGFLVLAGCLLIIYVLKKIRLGILISN